MYSVYGKMPRKVICPLCGELLEPPNDHVGDIWAELGCEQCRDRHDGRAKKLLANAGLLAEGAL